MKKNKRILKSVLVFFTTFITLGLIAATILNQYVKHEKNQYYYIALNQSNIIRDSVDTAVSKVYVLKSLIMAFDGKTDFFDKIAVSVYDEVRENTGIALKNIALAPNGVVEKVYPMSGNENLIGFNFMDETKTGNKEAIEAYLGEKMVITNPFELIQGGFGMAGRLPVFLEEGKKTKFWGLVTVTIDFDELMKAMDMSSLSRMNSNYCLWYENDKNEKVILSKSENIDNYPSSYKFNIHNITWHLDISPKRGWIGIYMLISTTIIIFLFSALLAMLYNSNKKVMQVNKQLRDLANIDPLSSCFSRNYLNSIIIDVKDGSWTDPYAKYSLMIVDIDVFKTVNDKYGHFVGDLAIKKVAEVLLKNIKIEDGDCVIRFGGDEFVVLINDIEKQKLIKKVNNIIEEVRSIIFLNYPDLKLSISVGVEAYDEESPLKYYEQIKKADVKLYTSKKNGRDQYTI